MPLITWNKNLSVNVPDLDAQHQKLIGMINDLHDAMAKGQARNMLKPLLDRLIQYTVTHFRYEEQYMQQIQYAKLAEHKGEHERLTNQVQNFAQKFDSGELSVTIEIMNFLRDWLTNHIQRVDKQYTPQAAAAKN